MRGTLRVTFKEFHSDSASVINLYQQAADFATERGVERVINISHTITENYEKVIVWYWKYF